MGEGRTARHQAKEWPSGQLRRQTVLVADDEAITRRLLEATISRFSYQVETVSDGQQAWERLQQPEPPALVMLDWSMPGMDGPEVCRRIRTREAGSNEAGYTYTLLVTARVSKADAVEGLSAGADDFISKPVDPEELLARLRVGERIVRLEQRLASNVRELQEALDQVRELEGLVPICMHCKRIRTTQNFWERVETYIERKSSVKFSHALCTDCLEKHYPDVE